jgi:hypothetical protein
MRDHRRALGAPFRSTPGAHSARRVFAAAAPCATVVSANFAAGCVGLFAPLGTAVTVLGLDWLHVWDVQQPILYGAAALSLFALAHAAWRHRRPLPFLLGLSSVVALLYPLHEAMDVSAFRWLSNGGAAGLFGAAVWSAVLSRRTAAIVAPPSIRAAAATSPRQAEEE